MSVPRRPACRLTGPPATTALALAACIALGAVAPAPAIAQAEFGAQSLLIDPSVRSAGMGRAGVAVFWGDDPNDWANPALLGYRRGIHYEQGETQLVPDLADDVYFRSERWFLGAYGIGLAVSGRPGIWEPLGKQRLDYG